MLTCNETIATILFFYGLAFFSLGLALLIESGRASELGFARSMRLLAGFGLLHGTHEWLHMFERGALLYPGTDIFPTWLLWVRLAILAASFIALTAFGEHLLFIDRRDRPFRWRLTLSITIWYLLSCVIVEVTYRLDEAAWIDAVDVLARYVLGIPGTVVACWALWMQRKIFAEQGMERFVRDLTIAALALAFYGIIGQFFTKSSAIFPSYIINCDLFLQLTGIPVQVFRAVMAVIVTVAMIRVLRALEVENQQRMEAIRGSKREAERQSHAELARLNAELRAANEEAERLLHEVKKRESLRGEFLQRITSAQESERSRVARELHDGTGQTLTGLALGLRGLAAQFRDKPDLVAQRLPMLEAMATTGMGELRQLINDLRPPQLDDMGLGAALRWMAGRFATHDNLHFDLKIIGEPYALSSEAETVLFRIAQEGLTNVTKHARASDVQVILNYDDGPSLTICDNGVGYDPEEVLNPNGVRTAWGLVGIQERANLINATLTIESRPDCGTTMIVRLNPDDVPKKEANHAD
jgi:signal transduction histidine kinase